MSSSIQAQLTINLSSVRTTTTGDPTATALSQNQTLGNISTSWNANTSPNGLDSWSANVPMISGTVTIDLTSLTQAGLAATLNETGNKLRVIEVSAPVSNAAPIQIAVGGSNGYAPLGTISDLMPGDTAVKITTQATAVSGTNKTLTISGTGTDSLNVFMIFGN